MSVTEKDTKNEHEMHVTKDAHETDVTDKDTNGQMDVEEPVKRRTVKLTAKALACKIEKVQKDRHSCETNERAQSNNERAHES